MCVIWIGKVVSAYWTPSVLHFSAILLPIGEILYNKLKLTKRNIKYTVYEHLLLASEFHSWNGTELPNILQMFDTPSSRWL